MPFLLAQPKQIQALHDAGYPDEVLERCVQGRIYEVYFDILRAGLGRFLPFRDEVDSLTLKEWIMRLSEWQRHTVETCWLNDMRGLEQRPQSGVLQ